MTHRRGNGLLADTYVPLILLPPALADLMLDALRQARIAAYAIPLDEDVLKPADSTAQEPPTDHLYVDANERGSAEDVLRTELPELEGRAIEVGRSENAANAESGDTPPAGEPSARDAMAPGESVGSSESVGSGADDDVWADLVARFYDSDATDEPTWPDAENVARRRDDDTGGDLLAPDLDDPAGSDDPDETADREARRARADDEEHYVPPPPPPLPRGDLVSRLSWGGLFGGPIVLLVSTLLGQRLPDIVAFLAVAAFIGGFIVLVVRMGDRPPRDSGPDDGAVI
ncbi:hypothetical protein CLV63_122105 [Murinocardiopsis flavida]|uniref:DUF308 domain-containing protein n=1 Tax=Murinocardiopsis flavida TaxID=645275 RepID=A0A2P8D019_9ACTN|nr:hypothetical protein [Murinocardiopsis flavida]PSK90571.1 hypothetical protein CLV63_122105 [Murinocardiopsis flavida]